MLLLAGYLLVVVGTAMVSLPAAVIVFGAGLVAVAVDDLTREDDR